MVPSKKDEAVWVFLTDLKAVRSAHSRLLELADVHPDLVLAYLESLSPGQRQDPEYLDLYNKIQAIAEASRLKQK